MRMNTKQGDEFRVWLTRRFSGLLVSLLVREIDKLGGVSSLASTDETRSLFKQGAMEQRYEEEKASEFPLGEDGILAYKINYKVAANANMMLEILPENGRGITLNLNKSLLFMFYNLLTQACSQADWRLPDAGIATVKH